MTKEKWAGFFKTGIGFLLGAMAFGVCVYAAWVEGSQPVVQVLVCLLGAVSGWVGGIFITPIGEGERKQFSDYAKAASALGSGYILAKLEPVATLAWAGELDRSLLLLRFLLFFICLLLGALFTFVGRRSGRGSEADRQAKRDKAMAEVQEAVAKFGLCDLTEGAAGLSPNTSS